MLSFIFIFIFIFIINRLLQQVGEGIRTFILLIKKNLSNATELEGSWHNKSIF